MPWLQIRIPTLPAHTDALEDALLLAGCQAVTLIDTDDQPVFEPLRGTTPLWQHTTIQGLFDEAVDAQSLAEQLTRFAQTENIPLQGPVVTEILEDKDWERAWMDNFKPIQCGERLWICPSWLAPPTRVPSTCDSTPAWLLARAPTQPPSCVCNGWTTA